MVIVKVCCRRRLATTLLLFSIGWLCSVQRSSATDYFLTIGGGYSREGNQASLEANVVFVQQILADKHRGPRRHDIFFADGDDPVEDLQVMAKKPALGAMPATDLLAALHRRRGEIAVAYRNHRVEGIAGRLDPALVRTSLEAVAKTAGRGDRLIIYVTAHGSPGPNDDPFNTTIDCWGEKQISAREFTDWLSKLPSEVPVVMVMAQCYCGGFARSIFEGLDEREGLASQLRAGFFAQQHDLPAAGCRPDVEHDEEFSSYFWGALAGRSRNGVAIECDIDGNGIISFAEAYAHAVVAGETIDIPLKSSDVFLRTYSRLGESKSNDAPGDAAASDEESERDTKAAVEQDRSKDQPALFAISGKLEAFIDPEHPVTGRIVERLSKSLGLTLQDDVKAVFATYEESRRGDRFGGRGRRPRQGSGRRELLREVTEKWPELGDQRKWEESALLKPENQEQLLAELKQLPSWKNYEERRSQMEAADIDSDQRKIRTVKFQRLIKTLELIVLEKNLPLCATPEIVERYQRLVTLEASSLNADGTDRRAPAR
jgi:hypothetical protein